MPNRHKSGSFLCVCVCLQQQWPVKYDTIKKNENEQFQEIVCPTNQAIILCCRFSNRSDRCYPKQCLETVFLCLSGLSNLVRKTRDHNAKISMQFYIIPNCNCNDDVKEADYNKKSESCKMVFSLCSFERFVVVTFCVAEFVVKLI
jgi:hypothetical protein